MASPHSPSARCRWRQASNATNTKATGTFIDTRRATPAATGITYTVLTSASPAAAENEWTPDTGATEGSTTTVGDVQTVPITLSGRLLSAPMLFVRVKAVLPP